MKFLVSSIFLVVFLIKEIDNAPSIHPIHVETVPLGPRTSSPSSGSTHQPTQSSRQTFVTASSTRPSTTHSHHHNSGSWYSRSGTTQTIIRFSLYMIVFALLSVVVRTLCQSKTSKDVKDPKKVAGVITKTKMDASTVEGTREEAPPAYTDVHGV